MCPCQPVRTVFSGSNLHFCDSAGCHLEFHERTRSQLKETRSMNSMSSTVPQLLTALSGFLFSLCRLWSLQPIRSTDELWGCLRTCTWTPLPFRLWEHRDGDPPTVRRTSFHRCRRRTESCGRHSSARHAPTCELVGTGRFLVLRYNTVQYSRLTRPVCASTLASAA